MENLSVTLEHLSLSAPLQLAPPPGVAINSDLARDNRPSPPPTLATLPADARSELVRSSLISRAWRAPSQALLSLNIHLEDTEIDLWLASPSSYSVRPRTVALRKVVDPSLPSEFWSSVLLKCAGVQSLGLSVAGHFDMAYFEMESLADLTILTTHTLPTPPFRSISSYTFPFRLASLTLGWHTFHAILPIFKCSASTLTHLDISHHQETSDITPHFRLVSSTVTHLSFRLEGRSDSIAVAPLLDEASALQSIRCTVDFNGGRQLLGTLAKVKTPLRILSVACQMADRDSDRAYGLVADCLTRTKALESVSEVCISKMKLLALLLLALPSALAQAPDELTHLSPTSVEQLLEFEDEHVTSTTLGFYPTSMFVLWIIMYLVAHSVAWCLNRWTKEFRTMSFANQRTSVIYIISICFTGGAFILQMACFGFWTDVFTVWNIKLIRAIGSIVTTLYIFELSYRSSMRLQMQIHHITTVFAIMFTMASIDSTKDPSMFITALAWLLQATTEQGIFAGLLMCKYLAPYLCSKEG
ncbi:hypothetical protein RQP46_011024 [Phenoliferia psychrophenolica]